MEEALSCIGRMPIFNGIEEEELYTLIKCCDGQMAMFENDQWIFQAGEELVNDSDWKKFNKSESIGFCFFDDEVTPEKRMEYVSGVVNLDRVVVFEHIGGEPLKKSFGKYRDPERDKPKDLFEAIFKPTTPIDVPEYSTKTYSQNTMRIVKIGKVTSILGRKIKWEE